MSEFNQNSKADVPPLDGPLENPDTSLIHRERASLGHVKSWFSVTLSRKNLMALTGLFLCLFLVVHLFGNLQLLLPVEVAQWQFNFYSKLLSENLFIELISYVLFASILAHILYALLITIKNRRANGKRYEHDRRGVSSKWYSRKMGLLGTIILVFLIIHLRDFPRGKSRGDNVLYEWWHRWIERDSGTAAIRKPARWNAHRRSRCCTSLA